MAQVVAVESLSLGPPPGRAQRREVLSRGNRIMPLVPNIEDT